MYWMVDNFLRINPDRSLEAYGEGPLEDEKHGCGADTSGVSNTSLILDLVDQCSLYGHDRSHQAYH